MAVRSSGMPGTEVYLVKFCWIAAMAASLICCGVGKCGSPAPNSTRSAPAAFSLAAAEATAMVAEISIRSTRSLNCFTAGNVAMASSLGFYAVHFLRQSLFHQLRDQAAHRSAEPENFFHKSRTQVRVGLRRHHEDRFQLRLQFAVHQGHLQFKLVIADGAYA